MRIAVYTNTRTTFQCCRNVNAGFITAFRGGQVLGFTLVGLALLVLHLILVIFKATWLDGAWDEVKKSPKILQGHTKIDFSKESLGNKKI